MKNIYLYSLLIFFATCKESKVNDNVPAQTLKMSTNLSSTVNSCTLDNMLSLQNEPLKISFFQKLDSIIEFQYPEKTEKEAIDINGEILEAFLADLKLHSNKNDSVFEKSYNYNLFKNKQNVKKYSNTIEVQLFNNCTYRLLFINYLETSEYADEGSVVYSFKINNNEIKEFKRQEAG